MEEGLTGFKKARFAGLSRENARGEALTDKKDCLFIRQSFLL